MCWLKKIIETTKLLKSVTYITANIFVLRLYINELKLCISSEAALGQWLWNVLLASRVTSTQRLPLAFLLDKNILSTLYDKNDVM